MKLALVVMLACGGNYIDPDGENVFFYEECLHMNRGKFTEELHNKCKKYSDIKLKESIWPISFNVKLTIDGSLGHKVRMRGS